MSDKLKPCPFCGGEKLKIDCKSRNEIETYSVRCNKCHARGGTASISIKGVFVNQGYAALKEVREQAKEKAIEAWNTRKPMDKVVEQLEKAKNRRFIYNEVGNVCGSTYEANIEIDKAIKIVRKGGVE